MNKLSFKTWFTTITCITLLLQYANAQNFQFNINKYNWKENPVQFTPDSSDKSYPTIYVFLKKTVEYAYNEKSKNVDQYFVSHHLKYINDNKSVEENNKIYISIYDSQHLIGIQTRVIIKGKVTYVATEEDFIQVEEDGRKYNMLAVKGLEKGAMVETITKLKLDMDVYGYDYMQEQYPVKSAEFMLITPHTLEFRCKSYNGYNAITDSVYEERRFSYATHNNIPAINTDEKYAYINANKMRIEYAYAQNLETKNKYARWPELGRIFFERIYRNYEKNEKDLQKLLSKVGIKSYKTDEEKIFAIENYIKSNIAIERKAYDDALVADILKRKYCSPYHMNQLFAQLYRKAGINFELVLTCNKNNKRFDPDFDSWSYLNDVLIYFPANKQFIDPQETLLRLGNINTNFLGQSGLFIRSIQIGDAITAMASVKQIPANAVDENNDFEDYTVTFNTETDDIIINYNRKMYSYAEQGIKSLYYVLDDNERKKFVEGFVKGLATDATITDLKVSNYNLSKLEETKQPLIITAKVKTSHYTEPVESTRFLFKVGELIGQQVEMYQEKPRQHAVDISFAHGYKRTLTINIPEGYVVKGQDKLNIKYEFKNENGQDAYGFVSSYKTENNQLIISCTEYYNELTYSKEQFENFKTVINAAADFNKISLLFEKQ